MYRDEKSGTTIRHLQSVRGQNTRRNIKQEARERLNPLLIFQKRALRIMTFSKSDEHSSPIFKILNMLKIPDLVSQNIAIFMYKYHYQPLPLVFQSVFDALTSIHSYNTRQASKKSYYILRLEQIMEFSILDF